MLSILIPTYNYNIISLVKAIYNQTLDCDIDFEILCLDDASTKYILENKTALNRFEKTSYFISEKNLGRTSTRQALANQAKFDLLLFLDADVIPKSENFISSYLEYISPSIDAIFGGIAYDNYQKKNEKNLRWRYGKKYEEVQAKKRNKKPYEAIVSANFLIRKSIFLEINKTIDRKSYGIDNYFSAKLKNSNVKVLHINNEVYHYGLETNLSYIKKTEEAISTLLWMRREKKVSSHNNKLLKLHDRLKTLRLDYIFSLLYNLLHSMILKHLTGKSANIYLLQLYKLMYICKEDLK